jgi:hypothetical protein
MEANLNQAKATLNKTEVEIRDNEEAMRKASQESSGLGDSINGLANKFGIVLPEGMKKSIESLNSVSASTVAFIGIAVKAVSTLVKWTTEAAGTADELLTLSSTTGLTTDRLQELKYASEFVDVTLETMTSSMTKMIKSMDAARDGTKEAAAAYGQLHIRVTGAGGQLRDANEVFYEAIDRLKAVKNETERDALAMQIFGKSARELNPLIEAGSEKLRELADEAHNMGYVISGESLEKLGALDDAMQKFKAQGEAVKNSVAMALLPILTAFFAVISAIPVPVLQLVITLGTVVVTIISVIKAVKAVTDTIQTIKNFSDVVSGRTMKITAIVMGAVVALIALATIIAVIIGKSKEMDNSMAQIGNTVSGISNSVNVAQNNIPRYASGTNFHPGGLAIVGENGPERVLLPRGSQVIPHGQSLAGAQIGELNIYPNAQQWGE